jgi:CHC2 zinc finger
MAEAYHESERFQSPDSPERRGVSRKTVIEAAKEAVPVIDLADLLCGPGGLKRVGDRWVGQCPLPDHEDRSPSFTVYPETNSWFCYGCLRGGDVIELARFAWGYEKHEAPMAAADVLRTFGHPIPERPTSWFRKQERQKPIRDGIEAAIIYAARRRLYETYFEPIVLASTNEKDRKHDAQLFWEATDLLARYLIDNMMGGYRGGR